MMGRQVAENESQQEIREAFKVRACEQTNVFAHCQ